MHQSFSAPVWNKELWIPHESELTMQTCMSMRRKLSGDLYLCWVFLWLPWSAKPDILFASKSLSRVLEATYKLDRKSFDVIWWHAQVRAIGQLQLPSLSMLTFSAYIMKDSKVVCVLNLYSQHTHVPIPQPIGLGLLPCDTEQPCWHNLRIGKTKFYIQQVVSLCSLL